MEIILQIAKKHVDITLPGMYFCTMASMWIFKIERLRELRELKGMSVHTFGEAIKRSHGTILNWEKGTGSPTCRDLAAIGNAFGVDPCSFFVKVSQ